MPVMMPYFCPPLHMGWTPRPHTFSSPAQTQYQTHQQQQQYPSFQKSLSYPDLLSECSCSRSQRQKTSSRRSDTLSTYSRQLPDLPLDLDFLFDDEDIEVSNRLQESNQFSCDPQHYQPSSRHSCYSSNPHIYTQETFISDFPEIPIRDRRKIEEKGFAGNHKPYPYSYDPRAFVSGFEDSSRRRSNTQRSRSRSSERKVTFREKRDYVPPGEFFYGYLPQRPVRMRNSFLDELVTVTPSRELCKNEKRLVINRTNNGRWEPPPKIPPRIPKTKSSLNSQSKNDINDIDYLKSKSIGSKSLILDSQANLHEEMKKRAQRNINLNNEYNSLMSNSSNYYLEIHNHGKQDKSLNDNWILKGRPHWQRVMPIQCMLFGVDRDLRGFGDGFFDLFIYVIIFTHFEEKCFTGNLNRTHKTKWYIDNVW